jgi:hypothetical protein
MHAAEPVEGLASSGQAPVRTQAARDVGYVKQQQADAQPLGYTHVS